MIESRSLCKQRRNRGPTETGPSARYERYCKGASVVILSLDAVSVSHKLRKWIISSDANWRDSMARLVPCIKCHLQLRRDWYHLCGWHLGWTNLKSISKLGHTRHEEVVHIKIWCHQMLSSCEAHLRVYHLEWSQLYWRRSPYGLYKCVL